MHIAVVNLTSGGFSGGYRKYLRAILPLMKGDARVTRITVCSPGTAPSADEQVAGVDQWTWQARGRSGGHRPLKVYLRALAPDVVLVPTARWIDAHGVPVVVMVRNMEPLVAPFGGNTLATSLKNIARRRVARSSCRRADRVIAVSQHVRDFLETRWSLDPSSIGLVYHGVSLPPAPSQTRAPAAAAGMEPTLFTAGSIRPARGLEDVIRATGLLRARGRNATLLIAGSVDADSRHYGRAMLRLCHELNLGEAVRWAGQLTDNEMSWCFYNAGAFVMTSRAEACPNTALEAMAHGALCVAGSNAPMPEMFGGSAQHYAPGDAEELARTLDVVLDAPVEKQDAMRTLARCRAAEFSWQAAASRTVTELEKCIRGRG